MRPARHTSNNDVLGVVSYWRPGPDELRLLNAGALVRLSVIGRTHPPLFVGVDGDGLL